LINNNNVKVSADCEVLLMNNTIRRNKQYGIMKLILQNPDLDLNEPEEEADLCMRNDIHDHRIRDV